MMKKTYKSSLLALSVLASFTSCSESESLQQANLSKDKIMFHATLDNTWKSLSPASSSRAAIAAATEKGPIVVPTPFGKPLYLHSVVQETADLQQAAATTRGAMQDGTTLDNTYYNNSFGVTAISNSNGANTALFTNQKASKNNEDIWEIEDKTNSRWPFDALVSFHAYAPFNDATDGMWSVTTDADNVKTKIKYTAKSTENEIQSQPDIIVATNAESRSVSSDDKAVELKFSHALTAVNFAISKDLTDIFQTGATDGSKLKSITLSGIPNEGTCELTAKEGAPQTPSQTWIFDTEADGTTKTGSYTFRLENKNIQIGESYALTSNEDKNILMMIPQDLKGTNAQLTFVLDIKGKGDQTFTFDLSNQTWLPGTSVTYKLSASAVNHLENAEVKFPESWKDTEQVKYSYPKTDFKEGESIGLYVVNSNNTIEEENVKLTRDQDGKWMPENKDMKFLKLKNYKYFAYYPYNAAAPTVDATKDNADEFFKDKISSLSVVADQSKEATLLAQDFQVAKGEIEEDGSTLNFDMEHQVGLAVLNLKENKIANIRKFSTDAYLYYYGKSDTEPSNSDYVDISPTKSVMASYSFAEGNIPCKITGEKYLQIIPFTKSLRYKANEQTGVQYSSWGFHKDWVFAPTNNSPIIVENITPDREFENLVRDFKYTGQVEGFTAFNKTTKQYKLQCWGADGATHNDCPAGKGGYVEGTLTLDPNNSIFICVGNSGKDTNAGYNNPLPPGVNVKMERGGGATSVTVANRGELANFKDYTGEVILVAGAGGGVDNVGAGGDAGGVQGHDSNKGDGRDPSIASGGTQSAGGTTLKGYGSANVDGEYKGGFGYGGAAYTIISSVGDPQVKDFGAQGGAGWYGGGGSAQMGGAGGGSSYGSTSPFLTGYKTLDGQSAMANPDGGTETGHSGNGRCIITWFFEW